MRRTAMSRSLPIVSNSRSVRLLTPKRTDLERQLMSLRKHRRIRPRLLSSGSLPRRFSARLCCAFAAPCAVLLSACVAREEPFAKITREQLEGSQNHGFVWPHHSAGKPLPGARYEAGFDTKAQFGLGVCRIQRDGGVYPGRLVGARCGSPVNGKELVSDDYDVLVAAPRAFWHVPPDANLSPDATLIGGLSQDGTPLPICVARYVEGLSVFATHHGYQPGVVRSGRCVFAWNGDEQSSAEFFLLGLGSARPKQSAAPAEPAITCPKAETPCPCGKLSGCTQPGYCPCPTSP
jgi:hypothetical protein